MTKKTNDLFSSKYNKKIAQFICDKIEEGMTLADVCKKYAGEIPNEKTLYRWQNKYPEFKEAIRDAYKTLLVRLIDTKLQLANRAMSLTETINAAQNVWSVNEDGKFTSDHHLDDEIKKAKFELDAIKIKQRALEFTLTRIAPKFVPDLQDTAKDNRVANLPPITIINYSDKNSESRIVEHQPVAMLENSHEQNKSLGRETG